MAASANNGADALIRRIPPLLAEQRYIIYVLHTPESGDLSAMDRYMMSLEARRLEGDKFFPGWTQRIYLDGAFHSDFKDVLVAMGYEVVHLGRMSDMPTLERMAQRHLVLDDETVDRFLVRDLDSTLGYRDQQSTWFWIQSGKAACMQHDHFAHHNGMMGGMWGGVRAKVKQLLGAPVMELLARYKNDTEYRKSLRHDDDQAFNDRVILPKLKGHSIHFDAAQAFCNYSQPDCMPFPTIPHTDDAAHMGKRAYFEHTGPVMEMPTMVPFPCHSWSQRLETLRIFADDALQNKWLPQSAGFRARCSDAPKHPLFVLLQYVIPWL